MCPPWNVQQPQFYQKQVFGGLLQSCRCSGASRRLHRRASVPGSSASWFDHQHNTGGNKLRFESDIEIGQVMRDQAIVHPQQSATQAVIRSQDLNAYKYNPYGFDVPGHNDGYLILHA